MSQKTVDAYIDSIKSSMDSQDLDSETYSAHLKLYMHKYITWDYYSGYLAHSRLLQRTDIRDRHNKLMTVIPVQQTLPNVNSKDFQDMRNAIDRVFSSDGEEVFDQRLEAYKRLIEEVQVERRRLGKGIALGEFLGG